jgi:hypothetical protein
VRTRTIPQPRRGVTLRLQHHKLTFVVRCTLGFLILSVTCFATAVAGAASGSPPAGNAQGLALLARVHRAYERVPAVETSARLRGMAARFTLLLRRGVSVGEEFVGVTSTGTTMLVARGSGPTFAREPGSSCWRRLAATDQQSLEDVGLRFPDGFKTVVRAPTRAGPDWLLPVHTEGRFPGEGGSFLMHIDAKTMLLESETGRVGGRPLTNHVAALRRPPALPATRPTC